MFSLLLLTLVSHWSHWTVGAQPTPKGCTRDFLASNPFFRSFPERYHFQGVSFLMEYARFMNRMAPIMLKDFVKEKKIFAAQETMAQIQQGRDLGFNTTGDFSATLTGSLVNSTSELMGIADHIIGIVNPLGIKKQETVSPEFWESACQTEWWPFDDDVCLEARCTACTPAVALAEAVCRLMDKPKSHRCMQMAMGEGYCNYCIVEFMEK
ncbi:hypothetical protein TCAL_16412 [Tigriopus californicus]|uniref:Uncharacterized protein n=1 Tax=Tigriopus californicus TaxID=6832 RepID=A0A553P048_TIGCA|nr:uncharacterized protein LOC131886603 isoform X1 [Tigriopus californicus]XP_059090972.1 uncharacterized protein LOC131886603 isoform X1 [Tigriopus californicus]TRY71066.1 hypothetical protein TCAL_16412 [Tigriopus californicus]